MKHLFSDKTRREKLIKTTLLILAGVAILLGATFAWNDLSQHKTDLSDGSRRDVRAGGYRNVTLNDHAPADPGWTEGETVTKQLSVTNLPDSGGLACVRLSLKEFMELRDYQTEDFYLDDKGEKILFATFADGSKRDGEYMTLAEAKQRGFQNYGSYEVPQGLDPVTGEHLMVEYATTNIEELRNGIYGKPMLVQGETYQMWGDAPRANVSHNIARTAECDYTPYFWDEKGAKPIRTGLGSGNLRDYVTLNRDEKLPEMITLQEWSKNGGTEIGQGHLRNVWVVDEKDGWVYWANRLAPGTSTDNLVDSVTFREHPSGHIPGITDTVKLDYYIHTDMQATDETQEELIKVFGEIDDPNITTIKALEENLDALIDQGKITQEKFDLIRTLALGMREVKFLSNLPDATYENRLGNMPQPQQIKLGGTINQDLLTTPTLNFGDGRFRFAFWSTNPKASPTDAAQNFFASGNPTIDKDVTLHAIWLQSFRFKMRVDDLNTPVTLKVTSNPDNDFIVNWNWDAADPNNTANQVRYQRAHGAVTRTYAAGAYTIEIFGTMPEGMTFYQESRLTEVLTPMLPRTHEEAKKDFSWVFRECSILTTIPEDLFVYNPDIENFSYAFVFDYKLTDIPEGLFANNPEVTNLAGTFYGCEKLTAIPEKLFAANPAVETFDSTFSRCEKLQAIPAGLFANNPKVTDFVYTFFGCKGLTEISADLFANNPKVTDFAYTFGDCDFLTSVPGNLFANNPNVMVFAGTFYDCRWLTAIPEKLFDNNPLVTTFTDTFWHCTQVGGAVPTLWKSHPNANGGGCFKGLTQANITNWGNIPDNWRT